MAVKKIKYRLTCVITEGDPYLVRKGDKFVWSRDEFVDDLNAVKGPPTSLEALKVLQSDAYLTWVDDSCLAKSFVLRIRKNGSNLTSDIYYIDNIVLTPFNSERTLGNVYSFTLNYVSVGLLPGEWQWSVASIFDDKKKDFSMWSEESLLIIK